ncbi:MULTISPECIES: NAD(P)H-dependent oxidoreductase [Priestia]|jgi:glutathione-regulated potassium-efflux system ancillary protein KefG|uniref:NAD(P)H-dependent oxidoreductase n=3 Tax=Priestia TaxID=2800373 RepID=A0ABD4WNT7_PRIMG|nr:MULTISPECIES: NAD(P)H-dependent oxidoreductase [Priestia]AVX09704.1 flavodoxin family protein [Bacillus sp. Y-01]MBZ5478719.1 NAD(P)H-dependent oxidoreductase [Bacillus sp. T_4]MDP9576684.1 glutathione-regulated potassium-efflux system ancillary protein KefG [Bacillus sp. 1751]KAA8748507.1 NAD(P)H-dependent oxidoreductase [Priestia megaterium]MBA9041142.1 glutathione-regulated potassium-efflux system ancillary protein KefG [Priestia aryabhattai]
MKTLVLIAHPHIESSRVNKKWKESALNQTDVTVHDLYETYCDQPIDVKVEQQLLLAHDRIVFQFPLYWYSSPPLLKQWFDEVFTFGWAHGPGGTKLTGKEWVLAISIGSPEHSYQAGGYNLFSVSEITKPFQASASLVGMTYLPPFIEYRSNKISDYDITQSSIGYVKHITNTELNPKIRFRNYLKQLDESTLSVNE